ncbi:serine/threonine-protein kinase [Archangium lansingense]|uniref:non-specific serine/threonine protein kinase n=1 Tax=Archangium lansingense TaxID=2995310 RepID=A0ABT4ARL0_9BACT|nr:serine/threonine-protein kinase [Archangium lansinium]MCY1083809.1 serine/threonine-protein kinase [Archangium lansinium]
MSKPSVSGGSVDGMDERAQPQLSAGEVVSGLAVEELVGVGGFATVYRARRPGGAAYALKFIPLDADVDRVLREFAILLKLRHRNLVQVVAMGLYPEEAPEFLWLQMGFVEGERLDRYARTRNLSAREVARRVLEVARGLAVAHAEGVVHRDVKEANVVVRARDGEAVLVDFGAGTYEEAVTVTRGVLPPGTMGYVSPEALRFAQEHEGSDKAHYRGGPGDDLYALGVVLYRLLTGARPFAPDTKEEAAVISRPAVAPHLLNPRVPLALSEVCARLLEKEAERRYASAELVRVLEGLLSAGGSDWDVALLEEPTVEEGRPARRAKGRVAQGLPRRWGRRAAASALVVAGLVGVTWAGSRGGAQEAPAAVAARAPAALAETDAGVSASTRGEALDAGQVAPARQETAAATVVQVAARALDNSKGQETAAMETKKRSAGKAAVVCTWAMLLAGETGCVGGPDLRKEPEGMACPAGSADWMRDNLDLNPLAHSSFPVIPGSNYRDMDGVTEVRDGQKLTFTSQLADRPHTVYSGQVVFGGYQGQPAAFIRLTYATIPGGKKGPVCLCTIAPLKEGSTVPKYLEMAATTRLYEGCELSDRVYP